MKSFTERVRVETEGGLFRKALASLLFVAPLVALVIGCATTPGPGLARGRMVFDSCVPCHGKSGHGDAEIGAPEIAGLPKWYVVAQLTKFQNGMRGSHPDDDSGQRMRPMARSLYRPGDVESVAQYLESLTPTVPRATLTHGDAAAGEANYTSICVTCHQADASGMEAMGSPPLKHQADWYMLAQLGKFKSGLRGMHPDDVYGSQMAAMSSVLADTTAMMDVIAYIRTLQK